MSGVTFEATLDLAEAQARLARLSARDLDVLSYEIGSLIEDQTKRRIADEKTAPDGTAWAPWSDSYQQSLKRRNRRTARSLLVGEGDLRDSIQNYTSGEEVRVGTNLVYGAIHQFGGEPVGMPIPPRPYLGLSKENAEEIEDLVVDRLEDLLQ
jgi:phage virion morphogenesis protein